uniref:Uncharacterized protein n=1 Tax=Glossina pallidipes TaxID=7398 RepID=A0A1A9ZLY2_GLOPL
MRKRLNDESSCSDRRTDKANMIPLFVLWSQFPELVFALFLSPYYKKKNKEFSVY